MRKLSIVFLVFLLLFTAIVFTACEDEVTTLKITYDPQGGTITVNDVEITLGEKLTEPPVPTRTGYTFGGWFTDSALSQPFSFDSIPEYSITLYAKWNKNQYTYTFYNEDGITVIKTGTAAYGDPIPAPETPEKPSTTQYSYTFTGWDKPVPAAISENISFTAEFSGAVRQYIYAFYNDGVLIKSETVDYGSAIVPPIITPTKSANAQYTYTFKGWDKVIPATITEAVTFNAEYEATIRQYTYTFLKADGQTVLKTATVDYGSTIVPPAEIPTMEADTQYSYTFSGWDKEIPETITEEITFIAVFASELRI